MHEDEREATLKEFWRGVGETFGDEEGRPLDSGWDSAHDYLRTVAGDERGRRYAAALLSHWEAHADDPAGQPAGRFRTYVEELAAEYAEE